MGADPKISGGQAAQSEEPRRTEEMMKYITGTLAGIDAAKCLIIAASFGNCHYKAKYEKGIRRYIAWFVCVTLLTLFCVAVDRGDNNLRVVLIFVLGIFLFHTFLQGRFLQKIGWLFISLAILNGIEGVLYIILMKLGIWKWIQENSVRYLFAEILLLCVCLGISKVYLFARKGIRMGKMENGSVIFMGLTIFIAEGILIGESAILVEADIYRAGNVVWYGIIGGTVILLMGLLTILLIQYGSNNRRKMKIQEEYLQLQQEYYTKSLEKDEKLRAFRHDFRHHIRVLDQMAEEGGTEEIRQYLGELMNEQRQNVHRIHCGNLTADAVFNDFAQKCEIKQIKYRVDGHFPPDLSVNACDLCTILANGMMNAYEACAAAKECGAKNYLPEISVEIRQKGGNGNGVSIRIENPVCHGINKNDVLKERMEGIHGFGLQNIQNAVKKYGGYVNITEDEEKFILFVVLL